MSYPVSVTSTTSVILVTVGNWKAEGHTGFCHTVPFLESKRILSVCSVVYQTSRLHTHTYTHTNLIAVTETISLISCTVLEVPDIEDDDELLCGKGYLDSLRSSWLVLSGHSGGIPPSRVQTLPLLLFVYEHELW